MKATASDDQVVEAIETHGIAEASRRLNISIRGLYHRRASIERKRGHPIVSGGNPRNKTLNTRIKVNHPGRIDRRVENGIVLVGSDSHYWPGESSTAHRAFVRFCQKLKPVLVIKNGDVLDGAMISRHTPIGWENRPSLIDEIGVGQERMREIIKASRTAEHIWPLGNHDGRFETRLAVVAPEYAKVHGVHLKDHFPDWIPCWSVWINDEVVIKHRFRGGVHATYNNTLQSGKSMVTGHLHSLQVRPWSDYNGTRFGVDCGTMADIYGPQFQHYLEDNPRNWRSGFAVLTFRNGRLLWPELVHVIDQTSVEFRGEVIET